MKKLLLALLVSLGLQTQAQISLCDSITYTIQSAQSGPTTTILMLNGIVTPNFPGMITDWDWQACDTNLCYSASGQSVTFNQFTVTDTIKVCLTILIDYNMMSYSCIQCDSLVYGPGGWMMMNMGNPTGIKELIGNQIGGQIYDLLGRAYDNYNSIPFGSMYIINRNKYLKLE